MENVVSIAQDLHDTTPGRWPSMLVDTYVWRERLGAIPSDGKTASFIISNSSNLPHMTLAPQHLGPAGCRYILCTY